MAKVMVGMSGGVDSSVAAKLLIDSGYDVTGVTLKLFDGGDISEDFRTCCSLSDVEDARSVCYRLGIDHFVFNFKEAFRKKVINQFTESYLNGKTPNPCIECNRHIKFDKMLRRAEELGFDYIATGHYAERVKDQTYVLYGLTQYQLSKTLFPLGEYEKSDIRRIAEAAGLINSRKPDSQDICFVPDGDYASFIKKNTGAEIKEGNFISADGDVIGRHKGIINYTIGQRRGIGISIGKPAYVTDKNALENTVTIGDESNLYKSEITAYDVNLISLDSISDEMRVTAKVRYSRNEQAAVVIPSGNGEVLVKFDEPQRAPASGQAVVFYDGDVVIGGGTIR